MVNCVSFVVPGLSTSSFTTPTRISSSSHHRILYLTSTDTPRIQCQKEVEGRVRSNGETRRTNPQKPKTKIIMKDVKKYKAIYCVTFRTGFRISERIWSMKVVIQSDGESVRLAIETLPVLLMNYQWSLQQILNRARESIVSTLTFRRTQIAMSA